MEAIHPAPEVAISHPPIHLAGQGEYSTEDIDINWTALIELLIERAIWQLLEACGEAGCLLIMTRPPLLLNKNIVQLLTPLKGQLKRKAQRKKGVSLTQAIVRTQGIEANCQYFGLGIILLMLKS